jgi:hypothetical protein
MRKFDHQIAELPQKFRFNSRLGRTSSASIVHSIMNLSTHLRADPANVTRVSRVDGVLEHAVVSPRALPSLWSSRAIALSVAAVLGFVGLAAISWLATGSVVPWDSKNHFYPMFRFLADALQRGEIPVWNPYHFAGHPTIADPQSLLFTPSMVIFALVAPRASMQLFDGFILAHLAFGGLCVLGLFRHWKWHPAGAVLAAFVFILGGAASSRLQHTGMILSYSYFPAALWALDLVLERRSWRSALVFGVLTALMAIGRDQVAFLLCNVLLARLAFAVLHSGRPLAYLRERYFVLFLCGGTAAALLAVPVLLTMQFLDESNRPSIAYGVAAAGSLAPVNLMTLLAPNFFGSLDRLYDYWGPDYVSMSKPDWTDRAVNYLFVGTFPILLVIWHGLVGGRLLERAIRFVGILLAAALVFALGRYTPIFGMAFDWFPGVSLYRRPADATFLVNIGLALGAGYLLHRYIEDGTPRFARLVPREVGWGLAGATLGGIVVLVGAGLLFSLREDHLWPSLVEFGIASALVAAGILLLGRLESAPRRALAATLVVALTGAEILWRNAASSLNAEPVERYSIYAKMRPGEATGLALLRQELEAKARQGDYPRVEILGLNGPWQNASMVLKLEDTLGYNPLRIDDYERAVGIGQNSEDPIERRYPGTFRGYRSHLASLLGIEYLVLGRPLARLPRHIPRPEATPIYASESMYIYRLDKPAPRVYFASAVKLVDGEEVLDEEALPEFDPTREVLIDRTSAGDLKWRHLVEDKDHDAAGQARMPASSGTRPRITITRYNDSAITIDVSTEKPGIVVLHDLYYPGWEVRIDEIPAPVLRANLLFRGVEVPAGHHKVEFAFRPLSLANLGSAASNLLNREIQ